MLKEKIMPVWKGEAGREVYGARKIWLELNRQGVVVARCTVERLMRDLGIHGAGGAAGGRAPRCPATPRACRRTCWNEASTELRRIAAGWRTSRTCPSSPGIRVYRVRDGPVRPPHSRLAGR